MTILEHEPQSPVTIYHLRPNDIPLNQYEQLGLPDLMQGYGFTDGLLEQAIMEYEDEGDEKHIFLAMEDGKALGSLVVKLSHSSVIDDGKLFPALQTIDPLLAAKIQDINICNVSGVLKSKDTSVKGLADRLYKEMNEVFHPSIIVGRTKNPDAVLARANSLARVGFRTWYGNHEVTPVHQQLQQQSTIAPIEAIYHAYVRSKDEAEGPDGGMLVDPHILLPTIKDVSSYPLYIQQAYQSIIHVQQRENILAQEQQREPHTAVLPFISIRVG